MNFTRALGLLLGGFLLAEPTALSAETNRLVSSATGNVYIVPIRENIMPPLVYVVRRGVKEAMEAKADALVLDMKTDGGRVDVTEEIIQIISKFPGLTVTPTSTRGGMRKIRPCQYLFRFHRAGIWCAV